jgi:23S rRNA pseudouridine1911/1915/1917 synthase
MEENTRDNEFEEEELFEHFNIKVDLGQEIIRIDKFLIDRLPNTSRNKIQSSAKNGNIRVNGIPVKSNYKVKPRDEIAIVLPYPVREIELIPEDIPLEIIFEDESLIVVNKPANMVVHPGYGNYRGTLVNALVYHFNSLPKIPNDYYGRPGLVHRIDKHTTGLLIIAKTEHALTHLAKQFFERTIQRKYLALVWGDVKHDGTVVGNVGRSPKNRKIMTVFDDSSQGKHAVTHYKLLENFGLVSLIECKLETGRTHQIRVHMKHLGHPLFNDLEYGGNSILKGTISTNYKKFIENCFELIPGQALHAATLGFIHPVSKEFLQFESKIPEGFAKILDKWSSYTLNAKETM